MGMGLGSCRALLWSEETFDDFNVRPIIGDDLPLYANLGIAQLEQLIQQNELFRVEKLVEQLRADGLIVHVNPLQEWLQPEGDRIEVPPIDTVEKAVSALPFPIVVKEVGQGMGYESLKALFQLPLAAIDFAASGGTNFSRLELLRSNAAQQHTYNPLALVGHTAADMVEMTNKIVAELGDKRRCHQVIVSGGVQTFLDGYYFINKLALPAIYGQASGFLKHARNDYDSLHQHVSDQVKGLALAKAFLRVRG